MNAIVVGHTGEAFEECVEFPGPHSLTVPTGSRTPPAIRGALAWGSSFRGMFSIGTGGTLYAPNALVAWGPGATGSVITVLDVAAVHSGSAHPTFPALTRPVEFDLSVSARIDHVRQHLSLTMTQLANVVGVARTTLYAWQDNTASPRMQYQRRLGALANLATQWANRSAEPVGVYLVTPLAAGATLLDLLSARRWNTRAIGAAIDAIATAIEWSRGVRHSPSPFDNLRTLIADRASTSPVASRTGRRLGATTTSGTEEDREPGDLTWSRMAVLGGGDNAPEESEGPRPSRRRRR